MIPELVVALFDVTPQFGNATQGGHYRDEKRPTHTLCGKLIVDKKTTIAYCKCTACYIASGATIHPRRRPGVPASAPTMGRPPNHPRTTPPAT